MTEDRPLPVWAGILAAGAGRRLGGRPKALLRWRGRTFLERIAETARRGGAAGVAVVLGHHAEQIDELARAVCDVVVRNPDPDRGMGSSARELARAVPPGAALLIWPVDTPAVRADTVRALIETARARPGQVVTPTYDELDGHPPLLPPELVAALRGIGDGERLDRFIALRGGRPVEVNRDDPGVARDIDLPGDLDPDGGPVCSA